MVPDDAPPVRRTPRLAYQALRGTGAAVDVLVWTTSAFDGRLHLRASLPVLGLPRGPAPRGAGGRPAGGADRLGDHPWLVDCQGHWDCEEGSCVPECDDDRCGDGRCDRAGGETPESCAADCGGEPQCAGPIDCLPLPWEVDCLGHWGCQRGRCTEVCDDDLCGDARCDPRAGESEQSCPDDCVELACVDEGLAVLAPFECCEGLEPVNDCRPGEPCARGPQFCVDCTDGSCDPHESIYSCPGDCPQGCRPGEERSFACPGGAEVPWCRCEPARRRPECRAIGTRSEGWYDSCSGDLYRYDTCARCEAECRAIGTRSEGWYESCPEEPREDREEARIAWEFWGVSHMTRWQAAGRRTTESPTGARRQPCSAPPPSCRQQSVLMRPPPPPPCQGGAPATPLPTSPRWGEAQSSGRVKWDTPGICREALKGVGRKRRRIRREVEREQARLERERKRQQEAELKAAAVKAVRLARPRAAT